MRAVPLFQVHIDTSASSESGVVLLPHLPEDTRPADRGRAGAADKLRLQQNARKTQGKKISVI